MSAPLFTGIPAVPPPWIRQDDADLEHPGPASLLFSDAEPGVLPPVSPGTSHNSEPPETVIQPPGAIVVRPRLAVPPARAPHQTSTVAGETNQLHGTSTAPLMAVSGDVFANGSPFQAPGVFIPNISVRNTQVGVRPLPYGLIGDAIIYDPALQRDFTGLAYLSAGSFGLFGVTEHNTSALALMGFFSNNFGSVGFTHYSLQNSVLTTYNAFLVGWRDYLGVSGQFVMANAANNTLLIIGGLAAKTMRRDVFDLGTYRGKSADALAQAHGLPVGTTLRRVEVRRRTGNTMQIRAGGGMTFIAGMLRADMNTNRDIAYRTFVTLPRAKALVFEGKGPLLFAKNKLRALGWLKDPMPFPDYRIPERIPLGDEIQVVRSGTYTLGVLAGQLAGWVSAQAWFRGDVELSIRRVSQHLMEVTITPIKVRSASIYAMDPFGPHAASRAARAVVARQVLTFDLRDAAARQAYIDTVKGKAPQALPKKHVLTRRPLTPTQQSRAVRERQTTLPRGVGRTLVHTLRGSLTDFGLGIKWLFVPTELLPKGFVLGLTTHRQRIHETQTVTNGADEHNSEAYGHIAVSERLAGGRKSVYTAAQSFTHGPVGGPQNFDDLNVSATYNDTRLFHNNYNRRLVGTVNKRFNADVDDARIKHVREERQMQLARHFNAATLDKLANWYAQYEGHGEAAGSARMVNVARTSGVRHARVTKLLADVAAQQTAIDRSRVVQRFVRSHHIKGFSALTHLIDADATKLNVSTSSSAYDAPISKTDALCLKYLDPITRRTPAKDIAQRYKEVEKALMAIAKGRREVQDDPLAVKAREYYLLMFSVSETRLYNLLRMPAPRAGAVQREVASHKIGRPWHKRLTQAVTLLGTLTQPVEALRRRYQGQALPTQPRAYIEHFVAMYNAAMPVRAHLRYLQNDAHLLSAGERALRIATLNRARTTLVGEAHFNRGTLGGLMNVGALAPDIRAAVRKALPRLTRDPALRLLKEQLKAFEGVNRPRRAVLPNAQEAATHR